MLRHLLYEAASVLMTRSRKWSRFRAWGIAVAKRRGMRRATVAVARKLAVILHRMSVTGSKFEFGCPPAAARPSGESVTAAQDRPDAGTGLSPPRPLWAERYALRTPRAVSLDDRALGPDHGAATVG